MIRTQYEVVLGQLGVADLLVQKTAGVQVSFCHEACLNKLLTDLKRKEHRSVNSRDRPTTTTTNSADHHFKNTGIESCGNNDTTDWNTLGRAFLYEL